ncbi:MAG: Intracellular proteinase inhibitor, partial [Frankiales bacterium]|nr:Intracellular proteinase inhibitor [Frankiales bacterium]
RGHSARPDPALAASGPMSRSTVLTVPSDVTCPVRKHSENVRSLCTEVYAAEDGKGDVTLYGLLCNTDTTPVRLSYGTTMELDVAVSSAAGELWRWSVGQRIAPDPHTVAADAGDCVTWSTRWHRVDQQGRALPAGDYTLTAQFQAAELSQGDRVATSSYSVY